MILGIDHVGIACTDIHRSIQRYEELFGLEVAKYEERPASGVLEAMLTGAGQGPGEGAGERADRTDGLRSYVQLLQPTRGDTALAAFLREHGEGIQHVGYAVQRIAPVLAHLAARGVLVVPDMPAHGIFGSSIAFLEPSSAGGVLTELVEVGSAR